LGKKREVGEVEEARKKAEVRDGLINRNKNLFKHTLQYA
jgi:hypothetical protein